MSRLTLLGTVHRDPSGLIRLVRFLNELKPDIITLEFSLYGLIYRQIMKKQLKKRLLKDLTQIRKTYGLMERGLKDLLRSTGIGSIVAFIELPFEYKAARFYSLCHHLPLFLLDISSPSRRLLSRMDELISPTNLKKIFSFETTPMYETVKREYAFAERALMDEKSCYWLKFFPLDKEWKKRDKIMAMRIRKILMMYPQDTIVHIGGWQHLMAKKGTLFNLLEDLSPGRVLLGHLSL